MRMNRILADFLNFAKPGAAMDIEPVDLPRMLEELRFLLRSETILNDVEVLYGQVPKGFPPVMGDGNSLKQVFLNITKNAIEAMRDGGRLEVILEKDEANVYVRFKDNGTGIPGERIPNVFRPFFTTKLGGTGLGLSESSSLVRRMGGELRVKSKVGEGTTVDVLLPLNLENEIEAG
ncbi:MAG: sensor histidine kinase [Ammonifex sp.]|jgi:signal transduction histidine kinase|nr:MAG: sensor histidine kinase [Ammonifex sp.]